MYAHALLAIVRSLADRCWMPRRTTNERDLATNTQQTTSSRNSKTYSILLIHLTLNILQIKMSTHIRCFCFWESATSDDEIEPELLCIFSIFFSLTSAGSRLFDSAFRHSLFSLFVHLLRKKEKYKSSGEWTYGARQRRAHRSDGEPRAVLSRFSPTEIYLLLFFVLKFLPTFLGKTFFCRTQRVVVDAATAACSSSRIGCRENLLCKKKTVDCSM